MTDDGQADSGYATIARLCGGLTAFAGGLSLLEWAIGRPFLTGLGTDKMPMAPLTAALFTLHGAALLAGSGVTVRHAVRIACTAAHGMAAALAAAMLFISIRGAPASLGMSGLTLDSSVGGIPIGHISPVLALEFLVASLSFVAADRASAGRVAWVMIAMWSAALVLAVSSAVVLAYVFDTQVLYGGHLIPPAVTSSFVFGILGLGLVMLAAHRGAWRRGQIVTVTAARPAYALTIFVVLAGFVVGAGYIYYSNHERHQRIDVERALSSVAEMKASELHQYRLERLGNGLVFHHNAAFADLFDRMLFDPQDTAALGLVREWLEKVREHYRYDRLTLVDARGNERLAIPREAAPMSRAVADRVGDALRADEITLVDFYRNEFDGGVYLDVLVPIHSDTPLGALAMRISPEAHIFPMLRKWPVPSATAETRLVRVDGRNVVFLSDLRAYPGAPLNLRFPIGAQYNLAAAAAAGRRGILRGLDYRGTEAIAAVREVTDSPWLLLASISHREAFAPLREQLWITIGLVVALLSTAGIAVGFTWRQQRARFYRSKYESERERAWLRDVLARSLNEIYIFDPQTLRFTFANEGACRNIGYTPDELARMTPLDIKVGFTEETFRAFLKPLRSGQREVLIFEAVHRRKDGSQYPVEVHLQYLPAGQHPVYLAVLNDISERQEVEAQLRHAQKMEAVGRLAGGVAHDFNNQVFVISGYCDLLQAASAGRPDFEVPLAEIKRAAQRAAKLTAQLLAFSRKQVLRPRVVDLNAEISSIDKMIERLVGETVTIHLHLAERLGRVRVDPTQLQQVIVNLVVNARDAMPQGGSLTIETADVELGEEYAQIHPEVTPGPYVVVSISDTGHGMDRETLAHLFEPFFTTKEPGRGTGLGLATAYGIAKQSGGHISASSEIGRGATFRVYLPRVTEPLDADSDASARPAPPAGGRETILLAEDEPAVRDFLHRILSENGYDVLCAADGREAVAIATDCKRPIQLLVTDVVMPEMTGPEVAERMRHLHPESRVLYMSGYTEDAVINHGVLTAGLAFLPKPCSTDVLLRRVREMLDAGAPVDLAGRRVLVVDDDEDDRMLVARVLGRVGCEVLHANHGAEALEVLRRERVDAVLTDINMPVMDGIALAKAIRSSQEWPTLPVVLLSGAGGDSDGDRGRAAGATACVAKGTANPRQLLDVLAAACSS